MIKKGMPANGKSFVYLSEQLKELGYINKSYLNSMSGKNSIFSSLEQGSSVGTSSTDIIKKKITDQETEWFQKFCT